MLWRPWGDLLLHTISSNPANEVQVPVVAIVQAKNRAHRHPKMATIVRFPLGVSTCCPKKGLEFRYRTFRVNRTPHRKIEMKKGIVPCRCLYRSFFGLPWDCRKVNLRLSKFGHRARRRDLVLGV
uniref:Uncharacterized protein n=1 Tax=Cryptomonas curvata TaxID=233186 RepID=A0A7S0M101_9CRYP|mmetsp:Transcript_19871/g.41652  ORF Transcript_19871/g.41652 Transcript_19871/m.41652 type:complete len:125 (+) Transcript_19871:146-520(+)